MPSFLEVRFGKWPEKFIQWICLTSGNPVTIAAIAHVILIAMHPFKDGNGRTGHLLMNVILPVKR